jgi:molecular chaperone GrpE
VEAAETREGTGESVAHTASRECGCVGRADGAEEWRDRALRLQAEIENFRKRQKRLADERIRDDRERLLRKFLSVGDDLERALRSDGAGSTAVERLREGIELTHNGLLQLLEREGVERIEALGQPFDPELHEGIATVAHEQTGLRPNTVAKVVESGYRLGDRLLRPARVVVTA